MAARAIAKLSVKKAKEERARLWEEQKAHDVNNKYPPWAHVDYDLQMEDFFNKVRDLLLEPEFSFFCFKPQISTKTGSLKVW
jgi:hypothetical protein